MKLSTAMEGRTATRLADHLLRDDGQEDLCFVLYRPSTGRSRTTTLIYEPILPFDHERHVHGNVAFSAEYFLRALEVAEQSGAGLALAHSHPAGCGWQGMSHDDIAAERGHAAQVWAVTGHPLVGLTLAGDMSWSARSWHRVDRNTYERNDHESVRVIDEKLTATFNPYLLPPPKTDERTSRTVSAWGEAAQANLARLHVAVVGLGSVGMLVAETLVRTGVRRITLLDFDSVETHNLDRLAHATGEDAARLRAKVDVARSALQRFAPFEGLTVHAFELSVVEPTGFAAVLDCDLAFSCVDRPWPRQVLDHAAFAHLIPVIDGGVMIRVDRALHHADWKAHVSSPARRCLRCLGQYTSADVALERAGDLDAATYIEGLPEGHHLRARQNVYAFSTAVASLEVLQFLSMVLAPMGIADVGEWNFHFVTGHMDVNTGGCCETFCSHPPVTAGGDAVDLPLARHPAADRARQRRASLPGSQ